MSSINNFLIKSAGMEKEARTAIAMRLLASTMTPDEVLKRFGKVKGQRYLDDVITATKNAINSKPEHPVGSPSPLTYLRRSMSSNAARPLYFNNKLSKSDYIKYLDSTAVWGTGAQEHQRHLRRAGKDTGIFIRHCLDKIDLLYLNI